MFNPFQKPAPLIGAIERSVVWPDNHPSIPFPTQPFPTQPASRSSSPSLWQALPDISEDLSEMKYQIFKGVEKAMRSWDTDPTRHPATPEFTPITGLIHRKFAPNGDWDVITDQKPWFPGVDDKGQPQYARAENTLLHGPLINHHLVGTTLAASGHYPDLPGWDKHLKIPKYGKPFPLTELPKQITDMGGVLSGYMSAIDDDRWKEWDFPLSNYTQHLQAMVPGQRFQPKTNTQVKRESQSLDPTTARRNAQEAYIRQTYLQKPGQKMDWYQFADIADHMAKNTQNEEEFRQDLWHHFGTDRSNLLQYFDTTNPGLPHDYKNMDDKGNLIYYPSSNPKQPWNPGEQLHHYLGGVTGDNGKGRFLNAPSHHLNAWTFGIGPWYNEYDEANKRGRFNEGDIRLFDRAREHYWDFNKPGGRFTLGDNIRKMLSPRRSPPNAPPSQNP